MRGSPRCSTSTCGSNTLDRQEFEAFIARLDAMDAKLAAQGEALRATRDAAPPPPALPPTLRQERAALWRIAMLCKDALASPALPPAWRPYFLQIARVCREEITREDRDRGDYGA
jgi:hypothetical protein